MSTEHDVVVGTAMRMAQLTDARDWDALIDVFADRVDLDYTSLNGGDPATVAAADVVAGWRENLDRLEATQHLLGTPVCEIDGDESTLTCAVTGTHRRATASGGSLWTVGGHYDIRLVRRDDGWRIAALTLRVAWATGNQAIMQP